MRPETSRRESPGPACPEILQSAGPAPRVPAGARPDRGLDPAADLAGSRFLRGGRRAYLRSRAIVPCALAVLLTALRAGQPPREERPPATATDTTRLRAAT